MNFFALKNRITARLQWPGMFNLNDPRWGRGDEGSQPTKPASSDKSEDQQPVRPPQGGRQEGPPDLDEFWRDLNRKFSGLFGKNGGAQQPPSAGKGGSIWGLVGTVAGVLLLLWLGTGFFIVQEGQQAVITQFGKYKSTVGAGVNWRLPYPIERHETVFVSQIRSLDIGRDSVLKATGLKESAMLTEDENILDIKFAVQYRLSDARAYLFESKNPSEAVVQAAETAVREVVGKMRMDAALSEERDQIAPRVRELMQKILDRYNVGIEVVGINLQQGGVRPPEQVQASFDDVLKAGQERERAKNEAEAYANDVIPRAVGTASRLKEEAQAYKARVVAQAEGDAQRFRSVLTEYQKAPQVLRDRMYLDTMQQIYSNVTKVIVDSRQNGNLLYLPLDKIMQSTTLQTSANPAGSANPTTPDSNLNGSPSANISNSLGNDARSRDLSRTRDRDPR